MRTHPNLYSSIQRGTIARENLSTQLLAYLLDVFAGFRQQFVDLVRERITEGPESLQLKAWPDADEWSGVTQFDLGSKGIADLVLRAPGVAVIVENKVDSGVAAGQLRKYRKAKIGESLSPYVVLLSKWYAEVSEKNEPHGRLYWRDVHRILFRFHTSEKHTLEEWEDFLLREALDYLEEQGMKAEKVEWSVIEGMRQRRRLVEIMTIALKELECFQSRNGAYWGFVVNMKPSEMSMWVELDDAEAEIYFALSSAQWAEGSRPDQLAKLGFKQNGKHKFYKAFGLSKESSDLHFFCRDAQKQVMEFRAWTEKTREAVLRIWES